MDNYTKLEHKIECYKNILRLANAPSLLIDYPELIESKPTEEDFKMADKWIQDYQEKRNSEVPF